MRRGENIFKRKDGRWEGRYICGRREDGRAKYHSIYAHSYTECSQKLCFAKMNRLPNSTPLTVEELFNIWLLSRKNTVKQSTYATYKTIYENYVHKSLGSYRISLVNPYLLNRYVDDLINTDRSRGKPLSAATVQSVIILLRSVFAYGEDEYCIMNPVKKLSIPKCDVHETNVFDQNEIKRIKSAADIHNSYDLGVLLCLYTGLRIGELCALKYGSIDTKNELLRIRYTLSRICNPSGDPKTIVIIDTPKSQKSVRDIPLPQFLNDQISIMKNHHSEDDYFLTGGSKYTEPRCYQYHYQKLLKRAGVPYRKFHSLRHTFATSCIKMGIDVKTVSELLGHSSIKITVNLNNRYTISFTKNPRNIALCRYSRAFFLLFKPLSSNL